MTENITKRSRDRVRPSLRETVLAWAQHQHLRVVVPAVAASALIVTTAAGAIALQVKDVHIEDAGVSNSVTTFAGSVRDVLNAQGVELGEHDAVSPALDESVRDGGTIKILRGKSAALVRDGQTWTAWVNGRTLQQQLQSLGTATSGGRGAAVNGSEGVYMMADRSGYLPVAGSATKVIVSHDQKTTEITVGGFDDLTSALERVGIKLRPLDSLAVAERADGAIMVRVERGERKNVTRTEKIDFKSTRKQSADIAKGETKVTTKGEAGERTIIEYQETVDGRVVHKYTVSEKVTRKPVDEVVTVGTGDPKQIEEKRRAEAAANAPAAPANPTGAQAIARDMLGGMGWGDDQFGCLVQLWQRESGWNVSAANGSSGAYGIPQALPGSKMASAGADWRTNPATQIRWGLGYIAGRYGTPCGAWGHFTSTGWY